LSVKKRLISASNRVELIEVLLLKSMKGRAHWLSSWRTRKLSYRKD